MTTLTVDDGLLYQLHLLLNPFVEPEFEPSVVNMAAEFGVAATLKAVVTEASHRFTLAGNILAARYLSAELCQLEGDMACYRGEALTLIQEARDTLAGACTVVSLSHHVLERVHVFQNSNEPPEGLQQVLELALGVPVPKPDYTDPAEREAFAAKLVGEDQEAPMASVRLKVLAASAKWLELAATCEAYPQAERVRSAIERTV